MMDAHVDDDNVSEAPSDGPDYEDGQKRYRSLNDAGFDARALYNANAFSDVTIKYGDKEIRAHRVILSTRSKYFERMLASNAENREWNGIIELEEKNERAVEDMLHWLYSYQHFSDDDIEVIKYLDEQRYERHLNAAAIAEKYGISSLEEYAVMICECFLECHARHIDGVEFAKHAAQYQDGEKRLTDCIRLLVENRFLKLFKKATFREWVAKYAELLKELIDENFEELVETKEFREYLKVDAEPSLLYADRLRAGFDQKGDESPSRKKRKTDDS